MSEFKVGDRVSGNVFPSWKTGTVKEVRDDGDVLVVQPDGYRYPRGCATNFPGAGTFRASDFTLLTPTFAVGDRVKTKSLGGRRTLYGVIDRKGGAGFDWFVRITEGSTGLVEVVRMEEDLELMQSVPTQEFKLKAGDKIRNRISGREGYVYPAPIARHLKVYDARPPYRDGVPAAAVEEYEDHHPGTYEVVSHRTESEPY